MYESLPSAEEMAAAGFTPEDYEGDPVEVWPENWTAVQLFRELRTQWRSGGMGGLIGMDYMPLFHKMDRLGLNAVEYAQLEDDIRVMEAEALAVMK